MWIFLIENIYIQSVSEISHFLLIYNINIIFTICTTHFVFIDGHRENILSFIVLFVWATDRYILWYNHNIKSHCSINLESKMNGNFRHTCFWFLSRRQFGTTKFKVAKLLNMLITTNFIAMLWNQCTV